jgi:putative transposase
VPRQTGPAWSLFLRSQAEAILACDFFTADLSDGTQAYVLAVTEHATRRIRILGVTSHPTGEWTAQQARNLITDPGEQAHRVKFMICDRGPDFTSAFDAVLAGTGIRTVPCNARTPRMNAIAGRWTGGCRRELLDRTLVWNQAHLLRILRQYETHHTQHRPHRSLHAAAPLKPLPEPGVPTRSNVRGPPYARICPRRGARTGRARRRPTASAMSCIGTWPLRRAAIRRRPSR